LLSIFARLDCLEIRSRVYRGQELGAENPLVKSRELLEVRYYSLLRDYTGNATSVMCAIFDCLYENYCPACAKDALERLDFSVLSEASASEETHESPAAPRGRESL